MNKAEKSRFTSLVKSTSGDQNSKYVQLFNFVNKQKRRDDDAIENAGFTSNDKKFLYDKVDEAIHILRLDRKGKYPDSRLKWLLESMKRLSERGLWDDLEKCIRKTKDLAEEHEQYLDWLQAVQWEKELLIKGIGTNKFYERYEQLILKERNVRQQLNEQIDYRNFLIELNALRIKNLKFQTEESEKKFNQLADSECLHTEKLPHSLKAKMDYYYSKSVVALYRNQEQAAYDYAKNAVEVFEKNEFFDDKTGYKRALGLFSEVCFLSDRMHEIPAIIEKIVSVLSESDYEIHSVYHHGMMYALNKADKVQGLKYIKLIDNLLEKHGDKIRSGRHLTFFYNISIFYCLFEQWEEATKWLDRIFKFKRKHDREGIQFGARLLRLIIAYESNQEKLEKHCRSFKVHLGRHEQYTDIYEYIIKSFKNLNNTTRHSEDIAIWKDLENYLTPHIKATSSATLQLGLGELQLWCQAKIKNTTIATIIATAAPSPSSS